MRPAVNSTGIGLNNHIRVVPLTVYLCHPFITKGEILLWGPEIFAGGGLVLTLVIVCGSVLCTLVITGAAIVIPFYLIGNNQKRAQELMTKGTPGEATILSLKDTGMRFNDDPRVTVVLDIRMPNMAPYQVTKSVTIPLINLSQVQTGSVVAILVDLFDPTNPEKIGLLLK